MIRKFFCSIFLILLILLSGCTKSSVSDLKIYILNRSELSDTLTEREIVNLSKTKGRLAFDGNDIKGYNWETQTVTLKDSSVTSLGVVTVEDGGSAIFKVDDTFAFALIIKNSLIYVGGFKNGTQNPDVPLQPYIIDNNKNSFKIVYDTKYSLESDNRLNQKLYSFLNKHNLLVSNVY